MRSEGKTCEKELVYSGSAIEHLLPAILRPTGVENGSSAGISAAGTVTHTQFDSQKMT